MAVWLAVGSPRVAQLTAAFHSSFPTPLPTHQTHPSTSKRNRSNSWVNDHGAVNLTLAVCSIFVPSPWQLSQPLPPRPFPHPVTNTNTICYKFCHLLTTQLFPQSIQRLCPQFLPIAYLIPSLALTLPNPFPAALLSILPKTSPSTLSENPSTATSLQRLSL